MDDLAALVILALIVGTLLLVFYSILIGAVIICVIAGITLAIPVSRGLLSVLRSRPRGR